MTAIKRFRIESGSNTTQENLIKSNEANLGKVALIQIIRNTITEAFKKSQKACSKYIKKEELKKYFPKGDRYPPKNKTAKNKEFAKSIPYSLR